MKKYAVEIFLLSIVLLLVLMLLIVSNSSEGPSGPGWEKASPETAKEEWNGAVTTDLLHRTEPTDDGDY